MAVRLKQKASKAIELANDEGHRRKISHKITSMK